MQFGDIMILIMIIVAALGVGFYFLNKWTSKRMNAQQSMIEKTKQSFPIYVIDKKKDYAKNVNLPKIVHESLPKLYRFVKAYFVQAKIGPQIMTLMCDKKVFNALTVKKNVTVELAGMYIVGIKGMKSDEEKKAEQKRKLKKQKQDEKAQKEKEKAEKKSNKK